jgi:hypothetical protein
LQTRLSRPLLAVVVTGAVLTGGAVLAGPAMAAPSRTISVLADEPTTPTTPADGGTAPTTDPATGGPEATPTDSAPATTDPTTEPAADPTTTVPAGDPTTTAPAGDPTTAPVDATAPNGSVKVNYSSLWVGQKTTLTLSGVSDDHSAAAAIARVVTWGDGTTSNLSATQSTIVKQYTKVGRFTVSVTLTDEAGNARTIKPSAVSVTVPAKVKLSTTSVWHAQKFNLTFSSVPSGTTKIVVNKGDGYAATLKGKNQTVSGAYYHRYKGALMPAGPVTLTAVYTNKQGSTTPIVIGKITIKRDSWNPHVTVTKPKHSERVSSWKTIHGTATDKGSGVHAVIVVPMRASGSKVYCYTSKKKWLRLYSDSDVNKCGVVVGVKKGKWSLGLKGLVKGDFTVIAVGEDWSDRASNVAQVTKKLTHS